MTFHERLLTLAVGREKASALIGDLEEDAERLGASPTWIRREALRHAASGGWIGITRARTRTVTTTRLALRDAWRSIWRFKATSALAIVILTLSIATGTATYAVVDGVVLRPLPYPQSDQMVAIFGTTPRGPSTIVSPADYYAWRERTGSFESLAAYRVWPSVRLAGEPQADPVGIVVSTASLFEVLRARPLLGTVFNESHEAKGAEQVAVISHGLWHRRFGGDATAIGRTIPIDGADVRVIGVMPGDFGFPVEATAPAAIWRPLAVPVEQRALTGQNSRASYLQVIGRLKPGVDVTQARADVQRVSDAQIGAFPDLYPEWHPRTERLIDALTQRVAGWMRVVLAAVVGLIVIACANVSNLLLTRSSRRARDISLRASLGATRGQLFAGLLAESFLLAFIALVAGVAVGSWLIELAKASLPTGIPRADRIALDGRVLLGAGVASLLATIVAGFVPAWQASRTSLAEVAREGAAGTAPRARRAWQSAFLVSQVAVVTILLSATTLLVASFVRVLSVDLGFDHRHLVGVRANPALPEGETQREALRRDFNLRAREAIRGVPGVTGVAGVSRGRLPLFGASMSTRLKTANAAPVSLDMHRVTGDYFATAGIPILRGRTFTEAERRERVAIIDAFAATQLFGTIDAVGRQVTLPGVGDHLIVGVTSNVRSLGPEGEVNGQLYQPVEDDGAIDMFVVRTSGPSDAIGPALQAAITPLMPAKSPRPGVTVVERRYMEMTADRRFNAGLMTALGLMAMVIGIGGIYASTATSVAQRTREIGIRMALGASASRVVSSITAATTRLLFFGAVLGVAGGWALSGLLSSVIFGITARDVLIYAIPIATVLAGGSLAALIPARRAARIDPLLTLRSE
jgi:putative ABC transport system permease protein